MIRRGAKLGIYTLDEPLGSGGMGEVYRALDQRFGRYVALKVLPGELAADTSRRARFEQEARHVAALNHPNIIALYDIGEQDGIVYMVTELINGTTLRTMKLSHRELLDVAAQIADGLAAAHTAAITHRDLKPENVMVTREGRAKILDFGVATTGGIWGADTTTSAGTHTGIIVGTVGYMAPEQVRGEAVGPAADIFAFGVLLYELIAGSRPFAGDTAAEVMTAILKQDTPELPPGTAGGLRKIVERCLEKKPERRFQSAHDLAFALRHLAAAAVAEASAPATKVKSRRQWRWIASLAVGFAVGVLSAATLVNRWVSIDDAALDPIQLTRITADRRNEFEPAISPDGRSVAYLRIGDASTELLVNSFDALAPISLVRSATALSDPVWIPDGNRICYTGLLRDFLCVGAAGGTSQRLLPNAVSPQFTPNGRAVYFARATGDALWLFRSSPPGANPERVGNSPLPLDFTRLSSMSPDGSKLVAISRSERSLVTLPDGGHRKLPADDDVRTDSVSWFPDNRHIAVVEETTKPIGYRLVIQDTETAARRIVIRSGDPISGVSVSPDGTHLVYAGGLVERNIVEYSGEGKFVRSVATSSFLEGFASWAPQNDSFVYRMGGPGRTDSLWYSDAKNTARPVQNLASNASSKARISPDGTRIAFVQGGAAIEIISTSGGRAVTVLQNSALRQNNLCWSPDSKWIWFSVDRQLKKVASEGGEAIDIPAPPGALLDCSPDGRWLLRRGMTGFVITSSDGKTEREIARYDEYASRSENSVQFGEGGKAMYALRVDHRTIDVLEVETGQKKRSIKFDIPLEDQIDGFSFNSTGKRVLLTTGGDRNDLWIVEGFAHPAATWRRWLTHWASPSKGPVVR